MDWRTSTYSGSNGSCVETASASERVMVRDSTDRDGGTLAFSADAWQAFIARVR
jgi:Domain of unknown function (DUF397)